MWITLTRASACGYCSADLEAAAVAWQTRSKLLRCVACAQDRCGITEPVSVPAQTAQEAPWTPIGRLAAVVPFGAARSRLAEAESK